MNKKEAIRAMLLGQKVKQPTWKQDYLYMDDYGYIHNMGDNFIDINGQSSSGWEIYTEQPKPRFKDVNFARHVPSKRYVQIITLVTYPRTPVPYRYLVCNGEFTFETKEDELQAVTD